MQVWCVRASGVLASLRGLFILQARVSNKEQKVEKFQRERA